MDSQERITRVIHILDNGAKLAVDLIVGDESGGFAGSNWSDPYLIADGETEEYEAREAG